MKKKKLIEELKKELSRKSLANTSSKDFINNLDNVITKRKYLLDRLAEYDSK
jgi:hypothetical protein